jgi:rhodanese-related sulfurtransferase
MMTYYRARWSLATAGVICLLPVLLGQGCLWDLPGGELTGVHDISSADAQTLIESHQEDANFVIIDVRTSAEFASGHIAGAVNVCVLMCNTPFEDAIAGFDKSATYLVYCGTNHRSPGAAGAMVGQGFQNVYNMLGGLIQWQNEGRPVVQ